MATFTLVGQTVSGDPFIGGGNINITTAVSSEMTFTDIDDVLGDPLAGEFVSFDGGVTQLSYTLLGYGFVRGDPLQYAAFIRIDNGDGTFQTIAIDMNEDGDRQPTLMNGNTKLTVADLDPTGGDPFPPPPCFTPGTMILTDRGARAVRDLAPGDRVLTRDSGYQPIRWIGSRRFSAFEIARQPDLAPVVLRKSALPGLVPDRPLTVSPQHRILVRGGGVNLVADCDEVLVPARHFEDLPGVERRMGRPVTYVHLMFDRHEIILSNGIWTETFQPSQEIVSGFDRLVQDEIYTIFPSLIDAKQAKSTFVAARPTLRSHEARLLLPQLAA